ncbi:hypothetical protein GQ53DRAFT_321097 [Thozetella sp. PMI_491]|nr:hypothetical protein GQ53DRAFT_321097 [Thozetella sp. PMI_491]
MRAVWSKIGQLQGCHCRTCLRPPSPAYPGRRKVRASEVFTACYTGIMATAAVLDAGQKDARRSQLDRQIDDAKRNLSDLMERSSAQDMALMLQSAASLAPAPPDQPMNRYVVLRSLCDPSWEELWAHERKRRVRRRAVSGRRQQLAQKLPRDFVFDDSRNWRKLRSMISSEERYPSKVRREPQNGIQFAMATSMIEDLVDRLLKTAYEVTREEFPGVFLPPPSSIESAASAIRLLHSEGYPRYVHPSVDGVDAMASRRELNDIIRTVTSNWDPRRRQQLVAKICYNLLVCPVHPGIHNYNALMAAFSELGEHRLANVVARSYLVKSRLRPTQATYLCLLHHYRVKGDLVGFYYLIRRLWGRHRRGMFLKQRHIRAVKRSRMLRRWAKRSNVCFHKGTLIKRAYLGQEHMAAILQGLVQFWRLKDAVKVFLVTLQEAKFVRMELLTHLLRAITFSIDFEAARILLEGFLANMRKTRGMLLDAQLRREIRHQLRLVAYLGLSKAASRGPNQSPYLANLPSFTTLLYARDQLSASSESLRRVECAMNKQAFSLESRVSLALRGLDTVSRGRDQNARAVARFQRLATFDDAQEQCSRLGKETKAIDRQFRYLVVTSSSPGLRAAGHFAGSLDGRIDADGQPSFEEQLARCGAIQDLSRLFVAQFEHLRRNFKLALLEVLPPGHADMAGIWAPGMTINDLRVTDLLAVFAEYLGRYQKESVAGANLETVAQPAADYSWPTTASKKAHSNKDFMRPESFLEVFDSAISPARVRRARLPRASAHPALAPS